METMCEIATSKTQSPDGEIGPYIFPGNVIDRRFFNRGIGGSREEDAGQFGVIGSIVYADQFNIVHHSQFCFTLGVPGNKITSGDEFRSCGTGLEAD